MVRVGQIFTQEKVTSLGLAGLGAVVAGSVQAGGSLGVSSNVRDLILVAVGAAVAGWGGPMMRAFGTGFAAAAVASLIRSNVLTTIP